jgi:hypothetical protein
MRIKLVDKKCAYCTAKVPTKFGLFIFASASDLPEGEYTVATQFALFI